MIRTFAVLFFIQVFTPLFAQKDLLILDRITKKIYSFDITDPANATLDVFADQNIFNAYDLELNRSNGDLYWSNGLQHTIMKANVAAPNSATVFFSDTANAIIVLDLAIDSVNQHVYWLEGTQRKIFRTNTDGSNVVVVPTAALPNPGGFVVSPSLGKIFYSDIDLKKIWSANLDGSQVQVLVSAGTDFPVRLAVAENLGKLYWTDDGAHKVFRINLDGSNVETVYTGGNDEYPFALVVDENEGKLYWTDYGPSTVHSSNLDGSGQDVLITDGLAVPVGLAIRGGFTTGSFEQANETAFVKFHPNPAVNQLTFEAETPIGQIVVYDALGRQVLSVSGNAEKEVLDISGLQKGLYVFVLHTGGKQIAGRFLANP